MKVLITGGCGFIGSHLADLLIEHQCNVTVVDNLSGGRRENIEHLLDNSEFNFFQADITKIGEIESIFEGVDWVFHLAGMADIVPSIENPRKYFDCNVQGTLNVLEASRLHKIKKIVYAASSSSYGVPTEYPTKESAVIDPQYPYALTKYMGEEMLLHWSKTYGINAISLRLFNVYGPRSRTTGAYGAVFGVFLSQKVHNQPLTIVGDGTQTRDFTYVTDVANAFLKAARSDLSCIALNVGSGHHYSVNHLADLIGGEVTYIPKRPGEPDCTFADTSLISELLDWEATVDFKDGVKVMLENIDNWTDAPVWNVKSIEKATKSWFEYLSDE